MLEEPQAGGIIVDSAGRRWKILKFQPRSTPSMAEELAHAEGSETRICVVSMVACLVSASEAGQ
jgi:hypothetical protein